MLTEKHIIAGIRWRQKYRRRLGVIFLAVGIPMAAWCGWKLDDLQLKSRGLAQNLAHVSNPDTQQFAKAEDDLAFNMGFVLGTLSSMGIFCSVWLIGAGGIWLFTASRRDALVLNALERNA